MCGGQDDCSPSGRFMDRICDLGRTRLCGKSVADFSSAPRCLRVPSPSAGSSPSTTRIERCRSAPGATNRTANEKHADLRATHTFTATSEGPKIPRKGMKTHYDVYKRYIKHYKQGDLKRAQEYNKIAQKFHGVDLDIRYHNKLAHQEQSKGLYGIGKVKRIKYG